MPNNGVETPIKLDRRIPGLALHSMQGKAVGIAAVPYLKDKPFGVTLPEFEVLERLAFGLKNLDNSSR